MAGAQTGTGKTAAFALPILQRLAPQASTSASPARHPVRALVLTPTRELAVQVAESFRDYGKHLPLRSTVVYGGVDMNAQIAQLRKGVEILVATPGRLLDHVQNKTVMFSQVCVLVLDEADRMLDMGFLPDIKRIIALLPTKRQNLLFSATFPDEIRTLTKTLLSNPAEVQVAVRNAVAALPRRQRTALVLRYFADLSVAQTADVMRCPQGTVKTLTYEAIRALRTSSLIADTEIEEESLADVE